jgi:hypothetical protein
MASEDGDATRLRDLEDCGHDVIASHPRGF